LLQLKKVSLLIELVPILIGHGLRPLISPSDDDVETLPVGSQLFLILLLRALNHALQDQVSNLEFSQLHLLVTCSPILLLIGREVDLGLLSPFL